MKNWLHVGSVFVLTFLPAAFIHKRILCIHNGLPWETCPSVWMLNQNAFFSGLCPPLDGYQRKKLTYPLLQAGHSRRHLQDQCPLYITSSIPLFSFYKKKPGIQTPMRWLFWDISLLPSQSASFLNSLIPCLSTSSLIHWPVVRWAEWVWTQ